MARYTFFTDSVSIKTYTDDSGEKNHIIEGYISTSDLDRVGDIVSKACLEDMAKQIKSGNVKLDVEHETWTKSPNIVPVGKIIDAQVTEKGLWVKAILNSHSSRFKEIWMSVKSGFVDAFSIAFKPIKKASQVINGKTVRLLDKVELLNVALTGNPANPECRIHNVLMKSLKEMEETKMAEQEEQVQPDAPVQEEQVAEVKNFESEIKSLSEKTEALENELKSIKENKEAEVAEIKSAYEAKEKEMAELKSRLDAAEKALAKPQMKSVVEEPKVQQVESEVPKNPLSMIQ